MNYRDLIEGEELWPVFIASKGRSEIGQFWRELGSVIVVEPQELDAYSKAYPQHPLFPLRENDRGLMFVRESIRKHNIGNDCGGWYWMLDDDITDFGVSRFGKNKSADAATVLKLAQVQAKAARLSAIGLNYDHLAWAAKKPLKSPDTVDVCGAFNANALRDLEFNPNMPMKGDREYCLRMYLAGHRCGTALKLWYHTQPLGKWSGGLQGEYQSGDDSREAEVFASMYPGLVDVVGKDKGDKVRIDARIRWGAVKVRRATENLKGKQ